MPRRIDLNCDMGEGGEHDRELLRYVTSANIACGVHAGSPELMRRTAVLAAEADVGIGAHPGPADRATMGRRDRAIEPAEAHDLVRNQVAALRSIVDREGLVLQHVKPHGALYNLAARDAAVAQAVAEAVRDVDPRLVLFALSASHLAAAGRAAGLTVAQEAFVDRTYQADGALTPRSDPDAMIHDPAEAARRALRLLEEGRLPTTGGGDLSVAADTLCVHGDSPNAVAMLDCLCRVLRDAGIDIKRISRP